jgi:hypothetical protein
MTEGTGANQSSKPLSGAGCGVGGVRFPCASAINLVVIAQSWLVRPVRYFLPGN